LAQQKEQFCSHQTRFPCSKWPTNAFATGTYSASPDPLAGLRGPTFKGRGGKVREGRKGKEKGGTERKGKGTGRRERERGNALPLQGGIKGLVRIT